MACIISAEPLHGSEVPQNASPKFWLQTVVLYLVHFRALHVNKAPLFQLTPRYVTQLKCQLFSTSSHSAPKSVKHLLKFSAQFTKRNVDEYFLVTINFGLVETSH